jgi:hypothetical protein
MSLKCMDLACGSYGTRNLSSQGSGVSSVTCQECDPHVQSGTLQLPYNWPREMTDRSDHWARPAPSSSAPELPPQLAIGRTHAPLAAPGALIGTRRRSTGTLLVLNGPRGRSACPPRAGLSPLRAARIARALLSPRRRSPPRAPRPAPPTPAPPSRFPRGEAGAFLGAHPHLLQPTFSFLVLPPVELFIQYQIQPVECP